MTVKKEYSEDFMNKIINFDDPKDSRTGFLSNESKHGFFLEDKKWPTVEHYIQAKKFEGTQYEEEIRKAQSVFMVKELSKAKQKIFIDSSGMIKKKKVYGKDRDQEFFIRKDWEDVQKDFLQEAVHAKFFQNKRLGMRLLNTKDAKLVDKKNHLLGPILEDIRTEIYEKNHPDLTEKTQSTLKDLKNKNLTSKEKILIKGVVTVSQRISKMENWDKIFPEMIEDAVVVLSSNKKDANQIVNYLNDFKYVDWTTIYRNLPNTENIISEIENIFKKYTTKKASSEGGTVYKYIGGIIRWLRLEATPSQKDKLYNKIKEAETMKISIPKIKRSYRQDKPPVKLRNTTISSKKLDLTKNKKKLQTKEKYPSNIKDLTIKEKNLVNDIIEEYDDPTTKQIFYILKNKLGSTPSVNKKELTIYIKDVFYEKEIIRNVIEKSPDKQNLTFNQIWGELKDIISRNPKIPKSLAKKYIFEVFEENKTNLNSEVYLSSNQNNKPDKKPDSNEIPKVLSIKDLPNGDFIVWGEPINKYATKLLSIGGFYPKKSISNEKISDKNVIQFRGKKLNEHKEKLLKPFNKGGFGGKYFVKKSGDINKNIIEVRNDQLEKNRNKLEKMGGKYPYQKLNKNKIIDTSRIRFYGTKKREVSDIIFNTLPEDLKYVEGYKKWIEDKIFDFIDTSVQVCYLLNQTNITKNIIDVVIKNIYGCKVEESNEEFSFKIQYSNTIKRIINENLNFRSYKFEPDAISSLISHIKKLGNLLIKPLEYLSGEESPTYQMLVGRLNELGQWVDEKGNCQKIGDFSIDEVCVIRALRHISACYKNLFMCSLDFELCKRAFITLVPFQLRLSIDHYVSTIINNYRDWMMEEDVQDILTEIGIKYKISEVKNIIDKFDTDADVSDCGVMLEQTINQENCEKCIIVFAAALQYIIPLLSYPENKIFLRRIKVIGADITPTKKMIENKNY